MKTVILALSAFALSATASIAADDPVAVRKALMQANAGAAGLAGALLKGEIDYNPAIAKASIAALHGVAMAVGDFFPEDSRGGETKSAPAVWEDPEAWQAALDKFRNDAAAAMQAAGQQGPADLAAFQAAVQPVLANCRSCHENFRIQN